MEQQTIVTSGKGTLSARDLAQGAIMAALGAALGLIYPVVDAWATGQDVHLNISLIWKASIGAGVLHIIRKLLSGPAVVITNPPKEVMQAVKQGEAIVEVKTEDSENPVMSINSNVNKN